MSALIAKFGILASEKTLAIHFFVDLMWAYMMMAFYGAVGTISHSYFTSPVGKLVDIGDGKSNH
jgi:hypothetical protein